jgi:hypothetical protein
MRIMSSCDFAVDLWRGFHETSFADRMRSIELGEATVHALSVAHAWDSIERWRRSASNCAKGSMLAVAEAWSRSIHPGEDANRFGPLASLPPVGLHAAKKWT